MRQGSRSRDAEMRGGGGGDFHSESTAHFVVVQNIPFGAQLKL